MFEVQPAQGFLGANRNAKFYVGFLKSPSVWFPLAVISDPNAKQRLDTLCVARSCQAMTDFLKTYASQLQGIEGTFVQFLVSEEVTGLMEQYGLEQIAVISGECEDENLGGGGCGGDCGCGCGCG
jgi:hypothetical protein